MTITNTSLCVSSSSSSSTANFRLLKAPDDMSTSRLGVHRSSYKLIYVRVQHARDTASFIINRELKFMRPCCSIIPIVTRLVRVSILTFRMSDQHIFNHIMLTALYVQRVSYRLTKSLSLSIQNLIRINRF